MIELIEYQEALCRQIAMGPAEAVVILHTAFTAARELQQAGICWVHHRSCEASIGLTELGRLFFREAGIRRVM